MNEHHNTALESFKAVVSWLAAALGIGTVVGLVNLGVGLLSGLWLALQAYAFLKYDLPLKRAKLAAIRQGRMDSTQPVDLT